MPSPLQTASGALSTQSRQARATSRPVIDRVHDHARHDDRAEFVQPELVRRHDAEVPAAPAQAP